MDMMYLTVVEGFPFKLAHHQMKAVEHAIKKTDFRGQTGFFFGASLTALIYLNVRRKAVSAIVMRPAMLAEMESDVGSRSLNKSIRILVVLFF